VITKEYIKKLVEKGTPEAISVHQSVAQSSKERFDNIISQLVASAYLEHDIVQTAVYLTQLIIEHLNYNQAISSIENFESTTRNVQIISAYRELERLVFPEREIEEVLIEKTIDISDMPILLSPWKGHRVLSNMFLINDENPLDGKRYNYNVINSYVKPLNVLMCESANHSQLAARYKKLGKTFIAEEFDISDLYDKVEYDGIGFRPIGADEYFSLEASDDELFYAGVLFELGRLNL